MRRRQLLTMTLALMLSVSAFAIASDGSEVETEAPTSFGVVVSCGVAGEWLPTRASCILKRRVFTLGNFELSVGVDGQVSFDGRRPGYLGGYVIIDYYAPTWGAFLEVATPSVAPPLGGGDRWRLGVVMSF